MSFKTLTFQPFITKKNKPPELPETKEEINELLKKLGTRMKLVQGGISSKFGTTSERSLLLECPFCKSQFTGFESSGCFHHRRVPLACPVCKFPAIAFRKLYDLRWLCKQCGKARGMHVAVDGNDTELCENCCKEVSKEGHIVTVMEPLGKDKGCPK